MSYMSEQASKLPNWYSNLSEFEKEKLSSDRFYLSQALAGHSYESLSASGWLNHMYSHEELNKAQSSFYTPFEHYAGDKKEVFILLNTGSYAPAHMGHISLLKRAKEKVIQLGLTDNPVMVLSPSHDKYVLNKSSDIKEWNINKRMEYLNKALVDYPYKKDDDIFLVDPWEAAYCEYPVNFTDVIIKYVKDLEELGIDYKIGYVFGSDNEQFLYAFSELNEVDQSKFFAICVEREGYPTKINSTAPNVLYAENKDEFFNMKSREIRKNPYFYSHPEFDASLCYNKNGFYAVRHDSTIALQDWIKKYPEKEKQLKDSYLEFHKELKALFKEFTKVEIESIDLDSQRSLVERFSKEFNCINLDIGTNDINGMKPLNYGRMFIPASMQHKPIKMITRPEAKVNNEDIPPGEYVFIDDDIASGNTLRLIQNILIKDGITFKKYINLAQEYFENKEKTFLLFDIVDTKDFLLGSYSGGLICEIKGQPLRLPYFAKYVNLQSRASIEYSDIVSFNKKLLELNKAFFIKNAYLTLNDIGAELKEFMFAYLELETPIYRAVRKI
jgi:nicotinic acid mononucleotide adenylyltransferase